MILLDTNLGLEGKNLYENIRDCGFSYPIIMQESVWKITLHNESMQKSFIDSKLSKKRPTPLLEILPLLY